MSIKIALITIHWANSYGGMLQALASHKVLSKYGEVSIIDYKTPHLDKTMRVIRYGLKPRDFLRMGKDFFRLLPRYRLLKKFKKFIINSFNLTQPCNSIQDLKELESIYDVFVCGSDQIWNPKIIDGFDSAYFLDFVAEKKKVSFASSAGGYRFSKHEKELLKKYFDSFSCLSVREKNTGKFISSLLENREIFTVLDPTLMLNKSDWLGLLNINQTNKTPPYVFVYTLKKDEFVRTVVNKVSKMLGLKTVVIDQDPFLGYPSDKHIQDAGPKEYIELLSQASFIITNSFHGTAFSVNFEIPFIAIKPESGLNRMQNFLANVGLDDRLILDNKNLDRILNTSVSFEKASQNLKQLRDATWSYLDKSLVNSKST